MALAAIKQFPKYLSKGLRIAGYTGQPLADKVQTLLNATVQVVAKCNKLHTVETIFPRCVLEVSHSWFNRLRKFLVRYEKMDRSYLGLLMLAASVIVLWKIR